MLPRLDWQVGRSYCRLPRRTPWEHGEVEVEPRRPPPPLLFCRLKLNPPSGSCGRVSANKQANKRKSYVQSTYRTVPTAVHGAGGQGTHQSRDSTGNLQSPWWHGQPRPHSLTHSLTHRESQPRTPSLLPQRGCPWRRWCIAPTQTPHCSPSSPWSLPSTSSGWPPR